MSDELNMGEGGDVVKRLPLDAGLYIVATPIGNLGDLTLRARDVLAAADLIACEDSRVSSKLLAHIGVQTPLMPYHDHNGAAQRPKLLARLAAGEVVALISDAGTPLISDPGYKLVRAVQEAGHRVIPIPGASAVMAALMGAGLPTDRFLFAGFVPEKPGKRRSFLQELKGERSTLVLFESARRLPDCLSDLANIFGDREAAVARELTKNFEELRRASLPELTAHYAQSGAPKGEVVLVIAPNAAGADIDVEAALRSALAEMSVKDAAAHVADLTGLPRRDLYAQAQKLKDGG